MTTRLFALLCLLAGGSAFAQTPAMCTSPPDVAAWPESHEAVAAAPKNHKVIYETPELRVLEVTVLPGEREQAHHHQWPSVMVLDQSAIFKEAPGKWLYTAVTRAADRVTVLVT